MVGMQRKLDFLCCTAARVNGRLKRIFALLRVLLINNETFLYGVGTITRLFSGT